MRYFPLTVGPPSFSGPNSEDQNMNMNLSVSPESRTGELHKITMHSPHAPYKLLFNKLYLRLHPANHFRAISDYVFMHSCTCTCIRWKTFYHRSSCIQFSSLYVCNYFQYLNSATFSMTCDLLIFSAPALSPQG